MEFFYKSFLKKGEKALFIMVGHRMQLLLISPLPFWKKKQAASSSLFGWV
jgi:hypothetical protein